MYSGAPQFRRDLREIGVSALAMTPSGPPYPGAAGGLFLDFPPQLNYPTGLQGVPLLTGGGGAVSGAYAQPPSGTTSLTQRTLPSAMPAVVVLFVGPSPGQPVALGMMVSAGTVSLANGSLFGPTDAVVQNGGTTITVKSDGTTNGNHAASAAFALPADGTWTISRAGEADGRAASASPVESYASAASALFTQIIARVNSLIAGDTPAPITTTAPTLAPCRLAALPISADVEDE